MRRLRIVVLYSICSLLPLACGGDSESSDGEEGLYLTEVILDSPLNSASVDLHGLPGPREYETADWDLDVLRMVPRAGFLYLPAQEAEWLMDFALPIVEETFEDMADGESSEFDDVGEFAQLLLAFRSPDGRIAAVQWRSTNDVLVSAILRLGPSSSS